MTDTPNTSVSIQDVSIIFGAVKAVDSVSLDVQQGEFFTLLGPSGCGKTTLLRTLAGFYQQTEGSVSINGTSVDGVPPHRRDAAMVFQNYAIFPHLNVRENIAYGLKAKKLPKSEIDKRIAEVIELVNLQGYEERMPKALSGGQQQRVVIARAVAVRPSVLLMDEPLANLDAKLRVRLREELKELQRSLGITTIYVTHDQEEALSLSDRIAVMSAGKVLQCASPREIYEQPSNLPVAKFIGEGTFIEAEFTGKPGVFRNSVTGQNITSTGHGSGVNQSAVLGIRPQDIMVQSSEAKSPNVNAFEGTIIGATYYGAYIRYHIDAGFGGDVIAEIHNVQNDDRFSRGDKVLVSFAAERVMVFASSGDEAEL